MTILIVLGGGGGIVALVGAVIVIGRGLFGLVSSTDRNTRSVDELSGKVDKLARSLNGHEIRIAVLEDRDGRRRAPRA